MGVLTMAFGRPRNKRSFDRFTKQIKYIGTAFKLTNVPVFKQLGRRVLDADNTNLTYMPIYENLELPSGVAAPNSIIEHFIREASHHVILNRCPCRSELDCQDFDPDFGCTFLGEGARVVDPEVGRHVSMEEALEHLNQAKEAGLISVLGSFKGDAIMLGVKDRHRLMTICHCCPCCCITNKMHLGSRESRDALEKLEGLIIEVDSEKCTGCSKCVKACIFMQMEVVDKKAAIGDECKGCGRCAMACPEDAIRIRIEDPSYIDECISRISSRVDVVVR
jgi:Pyruvate/2-oxoacid:ferredoxin oxidoreductase delta subunit